MKHFFWIFLITIITSCSINDKTILTLSTDMPEVIPLVEQFNKENSSINIILQSDFSRNCDIVIFKGQPKGSPYKTTELSHLFNDRLDINDFYTDIIKYSRNEEGSLNLIPISFDIPGLMYNTKRFNHNRTIPLEKLVNDKTIKFSPFWEEKFIIWYFLTKMPSFQKENDYLDSAVFNSTAQSINHMLKNNNDKWDENLFNKKYMHLSPVLLIESDIIEYYFINFSDYIRINNKNRADIGFSFLSSNDLVVTSDKLTYIGIHSDSSNKKKAEDVLCWILNKKNQNSYITSNIKDSGMFELFAGELSTMTTVSSELIPYHYQKLAPFIPASSSITIPFNLPPLWESLKDQVFIPAFLETQNTPDNQWKEKYNTLYIEWLKKHKK